MKYKDKEISEMTDAELLSASQIILQMHDTNELTKLSEPYKGRMKNRPLPETNPAFLELKKALSDELAIRNKKP